MPGDFFDGRTNTSPNVGMPNMTSPSVAMPNMTALAQAALSGTFAAPFDE
jgi:hypothetical protein